MNITINLKLAALWTSTPQGVLLGTASLIAFLSVMVALSLQLAPTVNHVANNFFGIVFTAIVVITIIGEWSFYQSLGGIETVLMLSIVWGAWRWPRRFAVTKHSTIAVDQ